MLLSIAGNTFDFGVQGHDVETGDFGAFLERMIRQGLDIDDTERIAALARNADVLYLADNCGEIYFDELLIEQLQSLGAKVTLVVRGEYILTDVTMEDVQRMGLDKKVGRVLTTGSNAVGVSLREAPEELLKGAEVVGPDHQQRHGQLRVAVRRGLQAHGVPAAGQVRARGGVARREERHERGHAVRVIEHHLQTSTGFDHNGNQQRI